MAGIYIHIPFCRQKCPYCNFFSVASHKLQQGFIAALLKEIEVRWPYLEGEIIETVYFGGGTPSVLGTDEIRAISGQLKKHFSFSNTVEMTLEANPDDVTLERTLQWKELGINRVSLGVQSFHDKDLKYLNRHHDGRKSIDAMEAVIKAGIMNLSIDLIYGIPTLGLQEWKENLERVNNFDIPHLSAYWLTVENGTPLEKMINSKQMAGPLEEDGILHFQYLSQWARDNNYLHYEISNLAKDNFFSVHNQNYWKGAKYIGFGPSAHSYDGKSRQWNNSSLKAYKELAHSPTLNTVIENLSPLMKYEEYVMMGLRTMWGIDLDRIEQEFGAPIRTLCLQQAMPFLSQGNMVLENKTLKLTANGYLISDHITASLFIGEEEWGS
jgi:oxygen-independent coproporphyrinogen-3 oxidase